MVTPMDAVHFAGGNLRSFLYKAAHARWHRAESKRQILRSQLGFNDLPASRPKPCIGCIHYHGLAYGYTQGSRSTLICGFHPYGWQQDGDCPDWQGLKAV
ncbi:MAG TPA: hypothetical protein V6C46_06760 [Coleofasciculaceae cyanobacterium]